jgi:2-dehydropantoate 2-reductase
MVLYIFLKKKYSQIDRNAAFSPVCAMTGMNTTELLSNNEALTAVTQVMREVIDAANAYGYGFDHQEQMNAMIARTEATAKNYKPSM